MKNIKKKNIKKPGKALLFHTDDMYLYVCMVVRLLQSYGVWLFKIKSGLVNTLNFPTSFDFTFNTTDKLSESV